MSFRRRFETRSPLKLKEYLTPMSSLMQQSAIQCSGTANWSAGTAESTVQIGVYFERRKAFWSALFVKIERISDPMSSKRSNQQSNFLERRINQSNRRSWSKRFWASELIFKLGFRWIALNASWWWSRKVESSDLNAVSDQRSVLKIDNFQ